MGRTQRIMYILLATIILLGVNTGISWAQNSMEQAESEFAQPQSIELAQADLVQLGGNIVIGEEQVVEGDVVILKGDISVSGTVKGNVVTMLGNITLLESAQVMGDVVVGKGQIIKKESAIVKGNLVSGRKEIEDFYPIEFIPGVENITRIGGTNGPYNVSVAHKKFGFFPSFLQLLGMMGLAAIAISVFPKQFNVMSLELNHDFLRNLLIGLAGWIIYPFVMLVLALTIIGIPITITMGIMIPIIYLIGILVTAIALGNGRIREMLSNTFSWAKEPNLLIGGLLGVTVLWLVAKAPLIGWLVTPIVAILGLGTILTTKFGTNRPWFKQKTDPKANEESFDITEEADDNEIKNE